MTLSRKIAELIVSKNVPVTLVVKLLTQYKMLALLPNIKTSIEKITANDKAKGTVAIESPFSLSEDSISRIKKIVGSVESAHEVTINKNILAGFKARHNNVLYDGSAERLIKNFITN